MIYPRLKLLKKLLADDGAIFISIDDNEQANLKLICDEIFGTQNFIANIAVINNLKGRSDDKFIATAHENLLIYRKENLKTNGVPTPEEYVKEYKPKDEHDKYRLQGLRKHGANSRREDRPNMFYPFFYDEKHNVLSLTKCLIHWKFCRTAQNLPTIKNRSATNLKNVAQDKEMFACLQSANDIKSFVVKKDGDDYARIVRPFYATLSLAKSF